MDLLSEVLRVVRLNGAIHFRGEFTEPWAFLSTAPALLAARYDLPPGEVTQFHVFVEGTCWVCAGKLAPVRMETGDVLIFPRGEQYVMASDPAVPPVPIKEIFARPSRDHLTELKYGGPGGAARFICGYLHFDHQFDPLLDGLPTLLCVRSRADAVTLETWEHAGRRLYPIEKQQEAEWWQASLRYLISETATPGPGNRAVLARLAESLFVQVLRWQLHYAAQGRGGWLAGVHDPQIGRVLRLLHALPERPWTVDELAKEAAISRATLRQAFHRTGRPIAHSISHLLAHAPGAAIAAREHAGHRRDRRKGRLESEAAFNRAFRRLVGSPPATWRHAEGARPPLGS